MNINLELIAQALENNEFFLEYMPIITLKTGQCIGAEALIRWRHQDKIIPPIEFIPLSDHTPISGKITAWVVEQVAKDLLHWLKQNKAQISINCPPEILGRGLLWHITKKTGLWEVAEQLIFEVTERGMIDDLGVQALEVNRTILEKKIKVAFDDVVINKSSSLVLSRVIIDIVKFDRDFMIELDNDDGNSNIIKNVKMLTESSCLEFIAEWVENKEQVEKLKEIGIQMGQGWYFSPPLAVDDFKLFFQESISKEL